MPIEPLVSTEWLAERIAASSDNSRVRIVHVSTEPATYQASHIPGALFSDLHIDLARSGTQPETGSVHRAYMTPTRSDVAALLGRWGVGLATHVVFYDDIGQNRYAARGYWLLRTYGFAADRVHLLDGGLKAWQARGRPTTTDEPVIEPTAAPENLTEADRALLATADDVLAWSREATAPSDEVRPTRLLDVRLIDEFIGTDVRAARGGRIPGSRHRLFADFLAPDGRFREPDQIRAILAGTGVRADDVRATYCQGGVRAALVWFALHEVAGLTEVRNYAGSWEEWGNRPEMPVET